MAQIDLANAWAYYRKSRGAWNPTALNDVVGWWDVSDGDRVTEQTGVSGLKDKNVNTSTIAKAYDFTSNEDQLTGSNLTVSGNNDSIGGEDNWWKGILTGGATTHRGDDAGELDKSKMTRITGKIFIPSGNIKVDSVQIIPSAYSFYSSGILTPDVIHEFDTGWFVPDGTVFRIYAADNDIRTALDADGDIYYLKDIVINESDGNDFTQATAANQPALTDGGTSSALVTFDGVSEFLSQPVTAANFQDLTYFEWWGIVYADGASLIYSAAFNNNGGGLGNRFLIYYYGSGDQKMYVHSNNNDTSASYGATDIALTDGYHVVGAIANGTGYSIYVDGLSVAVTEGGSGSSYGLFVGSLTNKANIDIYTIGSEQITSPIYFNQLEKFGLAIGNTTGTPTTSAERTNIFNYINNRFNLGL